jgi:hypothetical protein
MGIRRLLRGQFQPPPNDGDVPSWSSAIRDFVFGPPSAGTGLPAGGNVGDVVTNTAPGAGGWSAPSGTTVAGYPPDGGSNGFALGHVDGGGAIAASGAAGFAQGYATGNAQILASGSPSFAQGYAHGHVGTPALIQASGQGSFAQGYTKDGTIRAQNYGSFAQGYAQGLSFITSSAYAGFAQGYAAGQGSSVKIEAAGFGAFAQGYAADSDIVSSAAGSFAQGNAVGADIVASAVNSVQFGPGTNAQAESVQVGNGGIRLLGKKGAQPQVAFQDGDIWVGADNHVKIRSNGATVSI